jgi:hypothetical protein
MSAERLLNFSDQSTSLGKKEGIGFWVLCSAVLASAELGRV